MMKSIWTTMGVAALGLALPAGCGTPDEGTGALERREQAQVWTMTSPWPDHVAVSAVMGIYNDRHWLVYVRRSDGLCHWTLQSDFGGTLFNDLEVHLSNANDTAVVATEPNGSTIICDGKSYNFRPPKLRWTDSQGGVHHRFVNFHGFVGNDWLSCNQYGTCYGGLGNDTLVTWVSLPFPHHVNLHGGDGEDKLQTPNAVPVTMQGGRGRDCLYTPDTTPVLSYACSEGPDDPEWDRSAGFIGAWCNEVETQRCATWPW